MKTEPNVQLYTNLAKERICFCLVKVRERNENCAEQSVKSDVLFDFSWHLVESRQLQIKLAQEAVDMCSEAHQRDPRNANILRDRAEAYILNQDYEKGR